MTGRVRRGHLLNAVHAEIRMAPGRTEVELTQAILGSRFNYSRINAQTRRLLDVGLTRREGRGGPADPYRYYPASDGLTGD